MLGDLGEYNNMGVWGIGRYFESWSRKQFCCDCLIDNDTDKIGEVVFGIRVIFTDSFLILSADVDASGLGGNVWELCSWQNASIWRPVAGGDLTLD